MKRPSRETLLYFLFSLALMGISNRIFYDGAKFLNRGRVLHDLTTAWDAGIPFWPWTVSVYIGCIVFWVLIYYRISLRPREEADRFFLAILTAKILCCLVFVLYPTTNVRPELPDAGIWTAVMRFLYKLDSPENLFPSVHCMLAWICWVGVRGRREIGLGWRVSAFVWAVAVCLSTLTTRQHILIDVAGGILVSELTYATAGWDKFRAPYSRFVSAIVSRADRIGRKNAESP